MGQANTELGRCFMRIESEIMNVGDGGAKLLFNSSDKFLSNFGRLKTFCVLLVDDEVENNVSADGQTGRGNNVSGAPSRSQLMSFASTAANLNNNGDTSSVAPQSIAPFYGQNNKSSSNNNNGNYHKRTIAIQTGVELMLNAPGSNNNNDSRNNNNNQTSNNNGPSQRLIAELEETQEQLTRAREVVRLLDMQRQQFMYFVEDPRLEEDVARALGAGQTEYGGV